MIFPDPFLSSPKPSTLKPRSVVPSLMSLLLSVNDCIFFSFSSSFVKGFDFFIAIGEQQSVLHLKFLDIR